MKRQCLIILLLSLGALNACTSVTVDQYRRTETQLDGGDAVVVLGRRHANDYETEPDLIRCIGAHLEAGDKKLTVIPEKEFLDALYPWFEPRTAPMQARSLERFQDNPRIAEVIKQYNIRYMVWVDGSTEKTNGTGSINCSIGVGGAGCLGFGTWDNESDYETSVWDYESRKLAGKISIDASGTSYMPAIVVPIPLIAPVQRDACINLSKQLKDFLTGK